MTTDNTTPANGTVRDVDGKSCVFYDGYWIRRYEVPKDEAAARRELIDQLTKRVFHHTEPGINTPGYNLREARRAYEAERDPERRRVNAAMLAGALLNRGSDIFTMIFELNRRGIEITPNNELMLECESCFLEAFDLGKQVKHYSGEEGLDELWGEPLKVFYMPVAEFYESRYIKIALTMAAIDAITTHMLDTFGEISGFGAAPALIRGYSRAAKLESETIKTDPAIFGVWPDFVVAGDHLWAFEPERGSGEAQRAMADQGVKLVREGKRLIEWIAFARVPMPKTTENYFQRCAAFKRAAASIRAA
ncbi:MAG: hypothetical protein H6977_01005 [Gammaproteobacteria bacterium]|nr:hypothetical protein [Gammaproteobacteria bacterium]MCP5198557.1 hypothetical protein [Gammaproteobacteria bacterium]